jgi:Domain of unknown function (DUF6259)
VRRLLVAAIAAFLLTTLTGSPAGAVPGIRFADQARKGVLRITTSSYELVLSRQNGRILSLVDRRAHKQVVVGQGGCLWGARYASSSDYIGGCLFTRNRATARFSYKWDARNARLTLKYTSSNVSATARINAASSFFDVSVSLTNHLGRVLTSMLVPADLLLVTANVTGGYSPTFLPGLHLLPSFFQQPRIDIFTYPGRYVWADYFALDEGAAHLAVYSVNPDPLPVRPVDIGFVHTGSFCSGTNFCMSHSFDTEVADGTTWTSPLVRIRVGQTVDDTVRGYRDDNGIDEWPSVADKLGAKTPTFARAPLIKADLQKNLPPFAQWGAQLHRLPSPVLLHPVRYQPGLFDQLAPDFLPPDPRVGTMADLRTMIADAHTHDDLVMPYLNVSWWNFDSPTVHQLLAQGAPPQFAVLKKDGTPRTDTYPPFTGYVVSAYTKAAQDRVHDLMDQWQQQAPTDCYFIDQLGARTWIRDYNPAAPDPLSYEDGWLRLLAPYASRCLMVEDGWDRLGKIFAGFHGGLLDVQRESGEADKFFGAGNWEPYPIAEFMLHDKVLMYQHDLAPQTMTTDPYTLMFNVAYGYVLSYTWDGTTDSLYSPWLDVVTSFQHALGPLYAGQPFQSYNSPAAGQTVTQFPNLTVTANWDATNPTFLAQAKDDSLTAGVVTGSFDGSALSPGTHYMVETRSSGEVTIHEPLGPDTPISVRVPSGWTSAQASWLGADGLTHTINGPVLGGRFTFTMAGPEPGIPAPTYHITRR